MGKTFRMVDGDLFFDVNGRLDEITGVEKIAQDVAEVLLTALDVDRDFGSELNLVDTDPQLNVSEGQVHQFVQDAIDRVSALQASSTITTIQEEIAVVERIEVLKNDQTEILFGVAVRTTAGGVVANQLALRNRPVSLNHLLPPSIAEQSQEFTEQQLGRPSVITGEVVDDGS